LTGGWRKFHNEELHNLYSLPNIIRMTKSWIIRWAGNVASMVKMREFRAKFWSELLKGIGQLEALGAAGKII
jgi:hypothetical protein